MDWGEEKPNGEFWILGRDFGLGMAGYEFIQNWYSVPIFLISW